MSLLGKFGVTPLLYACVALLVLSLGLGVALKVQGAQVDAAQAAQETAEAQRDTAATERDAWKGKAAGAVAANAAYADVVATLQGELALAQRERARIKAEGRDAVAAAQAAAADADRTLAAFVAQFHAEARRPPCAAALAQLQQACPNMDGY